MNIYNIDRKSFDCKIGETVVHNVRFVHVNLGSNCEMIDDKNGGVINLGGFLSPEIAMQVAKRDYKDNNVLPCPCCLMDFMSIWR